MPTYNYIAIDARGARITGAMDATDPDAVVSSLTAQGMRIESVEMRLTDADMLVEPDQPSRLSAGETREIGGHIAEIVSAGMPLEGALAAVAEELPWGRMRRRAAADCR